MPGVLQKQHVMTQSRMHGPEGLANSEMWNSGLLLSMINKKLYRPLSSQWFYDHCNVFLPTKRRHLRDVPFTLLFSPAFKGKVCVCACMCVCLCVHIHMRSYAEISNTTVFMKKTFQTISCIFLHGEVFASWDEF